jgi:hypothetical protein
MALSSKALADYLFYPMAYFVIMTVVFAVAYKLMGLQKHFVVADDVKKHPWFYSFYVSLMAQTNAMGDAVPKTIPARTVFCLQTLLGWVWLASLSPLVLAMVG